MTAAKIIPLVAQTITTGETAVVDDDTLCLNDAEGRTIVRFRDGALELVAPRGDLRLSAPLGQVVIDGRVLRLEAAETLSHSAPNGRLAAENLSMVADTVTTAAHALVENVAGMVERKSTRLRQVVERLYALRSGRTVMTSERDTSIDGRRILLG